MDKKIYKTSKTISDIEKIDKNKINEFMINKRKKLYLKNEIDKINYKINKTNKNTPIATMHYSHNNIYLEKMSPM